MKTVCISNCTLSSQEARLEYKKNNMNTIQNHLRSQKGQWRKKINLGLSSNYFFEICYNNALMF